MDNGNTTNKDGALIKKQLDMDYRWPLDNDEYTIGLAEEYVRLRSDEWSYTTLEDQALEYISGKYADDVGFQVFRKNRIDQIRKKESRKGKISVCAFLFFLFLMFFQKENSIAFTLVSIATSISFLYVLVYLIYLKEIWKRH